MTGHNVVIYENNIDGGWQEHAPNVLKIISHSPT